MSISVHSPCANNYYQGDNYYRRTRGITAWNLNNEYTIPNNALLMPTSQANESATIVFTNTMPKCYSPPGRDTCNIVFNAWRTGNDFTTDTIRVDYKLNDESWGTLCYLSSQAGHGATQAFDIGGTHVPGYNDPGVNTFVFRNTSQSTIQLDHVKIYRTYVMCNTTAVNGDDCPTCSDGTVICSGGHSYGTSGSFDSISNDTPCNSLTCGGLSYTQWHDQSHAGSVIEPNETLSWTIDFSSVSNPVSTIDNYAGQSICLLNFNNVWAASTAPEASHDVELALLLTEDGTPYTVNNYYLSRYEGQALAPSYNLTQSEYYHDNGITTISLKNLGAVAVTISPGTLGGIDVYRIYQSMGICEDPCQSGQTDCPETCECCQSTCEIGCQMCNAPCVICYACYATCEDCQTSCELNCQTGCEVSCQPCEDCQSCITCQACNVSCQGGCQACEPNCQVSCNICYSCQTGCEECYECENCYNCQACYVGCDTPCVATCQTGNY